jgi:hypothetical protein
MSSAFATVSTTTSPAATEFRLAFRLSLGLVKVKDTSAVSPGSNVLVCAPVTVAATKDRACCGVRGARLDERSDREAPDAQNRAGNSDTEHGRDFPAATQRRSPYSGIEPLGRETGG